MQYTDQELNEILDKHERWFKESDGWSEEDKANLCGANLRYANLRYANLCGANLRDANLRDADLRDADLRGANLRYANLRYANLCDANLRYADLRYADLRYVDLRGADLRDANLCGANLCDAENVPFIPYACPDFGIFIGFKKASGYIVVLEILEDARRLSATGRKCRCDKAKVLQIQTPDGAKADVEAVASNYDPSFVYRVGEIVTVEDFNEDRWQECSAGIHFFINRQEAVYY